MSFIFKGSQDFSVYIIYKVQVKPKTGNMTSEVLLNIQNTIYISVHTTAIIVKFITAKVRQSFEKGRNNDDRHYRETD